MQAVLRRWLKLELMETRDVPAVWYVDPAGSDSNPGTPAAPLQTLQRAADVVNPGDTVNVRGGTYRGFNLTRSGSAAARITFQVDPAAGKGSVVVNQPNGWNNLDGINLEGASYITVDGFTVLNQPRAGIRAVNDQFVTISNNRADSNGYWGIFTGFSDDLTVENNETSRSTRQHGIYVSNSGDRPTVRGNLVWGNAASGIQLNADASMGGDGVISNAMIERNVIHDNGRIGGASINLDGVQSSTVRNNLIYNALASGIALFRIDGATGSRNNLVENNTVLVNNPATPTNGRWAVTVSDGSTGNTLRNNILYSSHPYRGSLAITADSLPGTVSNYNVVENALAADGDTAISLSAWRAATGQDVNSLLADDPAVLFVNAAGGDYHLRAGSPAIDRGTSAGAPPYDFEGQARPSGSGVDIGHDEYVSDSPPPSGDEFADDFSSTTPKPAWRFVNGAWTQGGGVLRQTTTAAGDPFKAVVDDRTWSPAQEVTASVRVDAWVNGSWPRAGVGVRTNAAGEGYNLVFRPGNQVQFLNDHIAWGNAFTFNWSPGAWYRFKLRAEADGTLRGKVWAAGSTEPLDWMFTQAGWTGRTGGSPALNGGSNGDGSSAVSFDDVTARNVTASGPLFADDFSAGALGSGWAVGNGTWGVSGGALGQTSTAVVNERKATVTGVAAGAAGEIEARVRVDSWVSGSYARAGVGLGTDANGWGYNLVFRDGNQVQFLNDRVVWGNAFTFNWTAGTWYHVRLRQEADGTLRGKVWADGTTEPAGWMFTQTGWAYRTGWASLNGGSAAPGQGNSTVSFDDVKLWA